MADLDDDEKWFAYEYFPTLITESESSPDDALKYIAEVATSVTNTAMRRILHSCTPAVRAGLLMIILRCLPAEVYSDQSIFNAVTPVQTACDSSVTL